jgi:hypothetical protein
MPVVAQSVSVSRPLPVLTPAPIVPTEPVPTILSSLSRLSSVESSSADSGVLDSSGVDSSSVDSSKAVLSLSFETAIGRTTFNDAFVSQYSSPNADAAKNYVANGATAYEQSASSVAAQSMISSVADTQNFFVPRVAAPIAPASSEASLPESSKPLLSALGRNAAVAPATEQNFSSVVANVTSNAQNPAPRNTVTQIDTSRIKTSQIEASYFDTNQIDTNQIDASQIDASQIDVSQTNLSQMGGSQGMNADPEISNQTAASSFSAAMPAELSSSAQSLVPTLVQSADDSTTIDDGVEAVQNASTDPLMSTAVAAVGTTTADDDLTSDAFPHKSESDLPLGFKNDLDLPITIDAPDLEIPPIAAASANSESANIPAVQISSAIAPAHPGARTAAATAEKPAAHTVQTSQSADLPDRNPSNANFPKPSARVDAAAPSGATSRANSPSHQSAISQPSETPNGSTNLPIIPLSHALANDQRSPQLNKSIDSEPTTSPNAASQTAPVRDDNQNQISANNQDKQDAGASDSSSGKVSASTLPSDVQPAVPVAALTPAVTDATSPAPTPATTAPASIPSLIPANSPDASRPGKPAAQDLPSAVEPQPAPPLGPVQMAQMVSKAAQSEMRVGLTTTAFGNVEVRTTVRANDVGVLIGSEKGDLHSLMANDLPGIANTLQQQNLRLNQVNFHHGFSFSNQTSSGGGSGQRGFSPRPAPVSTQAIESVNPESGDSVENSSAGAYGGGLSVIA